MSHDTVSFIALCIGLLIFLLVVSLVSKNYSLNRIKSKTVGDGQQGESNRNYQISFITNGIKVLSHLIGIAICVDSAWVAFCFYL